MPIPFRGEVIFTCYVLVSCVIGLLASSPRRALLYSLGLGIAVGGGSGAVALYLGRRLCGLKLTELAREGEIRNYGVVATNSRRYERLLERDRAEKKRMAKVLRLLNCEM